MQGCKYNADYDVSTVKVTCKYDYINIPIMANVYLAPGLAVKLGVQPGFNVNDKEEMTVVGVKEKQNADLKTFDFAIPVGLSYEFSNIVIDARYNWGLTKVAENSDSKNSVFQITLGYKLPL
jgi:hypothetical protein